MPRNRLPIRGGNWDNGANAGVFALNLNNPRSNSDNDIGFRSALAHLVRSERLTGRSPVRGIKGHSSMLAEREQKTKLSGRQLVAGDGERCHA